MSNDTQAPAPAASTPSAQPKPKKSAAEEIALLKAQASEAQSQLDDALATMKRQAQQIELLAAEKAAWVADEGLRQVAANELLNELNGLRAQTEAQTKEIARLRSDLKNAGSPELAAQISAQNETIARLTREIDRLTAENAKLRSHQGSHTALTHEQVKTRIAANPMTKFMAIAPYEHGTFRAVRGQTYEARLFPNLDGHVRNGLLLVVVEDALSPKAA